jgi:hypothetical protein
MKKALSGVGAAVGILVMALAVYVATENYQNPPRPKALGPFRTAVPSHGAWSEAKSDYEWGRYRRPLHNLNYDFAEGSYLSTLTTLKRWHYHSIVTDRHFVGLLIAHVRTRRARLLFVLSPFAEGLACLVSPPLYVLLVQIGYVANGFAYVVDKKTGQKSEFSALSPAAMAITEFPDHSMGGCAAWDGHSARMTFCADKGTIEFEGPLTDPTGVTRTVSVSAVMATDGESLAMLHPLQPKRPGYTEKRVGARVTGTIRFDDGPAEPLNGVGGVDWTKSLAERVTRWKWCSLSYRTAAGVQIGINLSDEVYVSDAGITQENAVWIDGKVFAVDAPVRFALPAGAADEWKSKAWNITAEDDGGEIALALRFHPVGTREEHLNLVRPHTHTPTRTQNCRDRCTSACSSAVHFFGVGLWRCAKGLIASDFVQPFGVFDGTVTVRDLSTGHTTTHTITNGFGVVENHYAKW